MTNTYAIVTAGDHYHVTVNDRPIIHSATRQPLAFPTAEAAQAFIAVQIAADRRHGPL